MEAVHDIHKHLSVRMVVGRRRRRRRYVGR